MNFRYFWHKLFHAPNVIFYYDEDERDVYERTKEGLLKASAKSGSFVIEYDDDSLTISVWRTRDMP